MNKIKDAVMGFAVGDAFGVPYEFQPRGCLQSEEMIGGGVHGQAPGTWSDDTSMVLATLDAMTNKSINDIKLGDIMTNFVDWTTKGKFTPWGEVFDIGDRTAQAITYYMTNGYLLNDNDIRSNGNGSLMRILPFAFFNEMNEYAIGIMSALTHPHKISKKACWMYVQIIRFMLDHPKAFKKEILTYIEKINTVIDMNKITIDKPDSDGYVVHSLEAALWAFLNTDSYREAILNAVNLGSDTDTIAALTGALAGLYYGYDAIPKDWLETLVQRDYIENLCEKVNFMQ